jgi:hypothetical protein
VAGRSGSDLAGHAVEALFEHHPQRPPGAVAGEDVEVVDVEVALAVRGARLGRVDLVEPVVGDELSRRVQDHAAQRVSLVRVCVDPPVGAGEVLVDGLGDGDGTGEVMMILPSICREVRLV